MSRKQSKVALENYVKSLVNRRDVLERHKREMSRDLSEMEEELRTKYNDPNYGGCLKIKGVRRVRSIEDNPPPLQDIAADIAGKIANPNRAKEETLLEVSSNPDPEITGINVDVLMKVVRASVDISDCFFEGTTKEERQQLLSDIEKADIRYG